MMLRGFLTTLASTISRHAPPAAAPARYYGDKFSQPGDYLISRMTLRALSAVNTLMAARAASFTLPFKRRWHISA